MLTLGWLIWEAMSHAPARLGRFRLTDSLTRALLVVALTVEAVPWTVGGIELIQRHAEAARSWGLYPADPIYPWFRDEVTSPVVVLASDLQGIRIPAYSSEANVVSRRGSVVLLVLPKLEQRAPGRIEGPQGPLDARQFFNGTTFKRKVEILRRHEVDYVMVRSDSRLSRDIDELPGFHPLEEPSERYDVYAVNLGKLGRLVESPYTR
jgi:hypothetical protein